MTEMALTADHLIVIGRGHIIADGPVDEIIARGTKATVLVRSPHADQLAAVLAGPEVVVTAKEPGLLEVFGSTAEQIGDAAAAARLTLHELTPLSGSLEDAYLSLTADEVEYRSDLHPSGDASSDGAPSAASSTDAPSPAQATAAPVAEEVAR